MKALTTDCIMTGLASKADGSLSLRFVTPELNSNEKLALLELHNRNMVMLLQPKDEPPEELVSVESECEHKTKSQRLRGVLFVWWKSLVEPKPTFEQFYDAHMEHFIEHIKTKLPPVYEK